MYRSALTYIYPPLHEESKKKVQKSCNKRPRAHILPLLSFCCRFFSYDLANRIAPRFQKLKHRGLDFTLRHMLACTDDQFVQRMLDAQARGVFGAEMRTKEVRHAGLCTDMRKNCDETRRGVEGEGGEEEEEEIDEGNEEEEDRDSTLFVDNDDHYVGDNETYVGDNETHVENINIDNKQ